MRKPREKTRVDRPHKTFKNQEYQPLRGPGDISRIIYAYDERDNLVDQAYFGGDGRPVARNGVSRVFTRYDERDNPVETIFYGVDGLPVCPPDSRVAPTSRYSIPSLPGIRFSACGLKVTRYDDRDNLVEEVQLGPDGQPVRTFDRVASHVTVRNDPAGRGFEWAYFDADRPGR